MNQSLLTHAASPALDKLLTYVKEKKTAALTGLPDSMTAFVAAKIAAEAGIDMVIMNGRNPELLYDLFEDKDIGTIFKAIPHRACAKDAKSDFSSDCTEIPKAY